MKNITQHIINKVELGDEYLFRLYEKINAIFDETSEPELKKQLSSLEMLKNPPRNLVEQALTLENQANGLIRTGIQMKFHARLNMMQMNVTKEGTALDLDLAGAVDAASKIVTTRSRYVAIIMLARVRGWDVEYSKLARVIEEHDGVDYHSLRQNLGKADEILDGGATVIDDWTVGGKANKKLREIIEIAKVVSPFIPDRKGGNPLFSATRP